MAQSPLATTCGVWRVAALLVFLSLACPAPALVMPSLRFADGIPKATKLSPPLVRLRTAVLRKSASAANMTEAALASRPRRRVARLVRAAGVKLAPNDASDLIDSIPTQWSARKRRLAVELVLAFAEHGGIVVRRGTFYSLVGACRKAGELSQAEALVSRLHACGLAANPTVYSALMKDLCAAGQAEAAVRLEASMRAAGARPSNETHAVLLTALMRHGHAPLALAHARRLGASGAPLGSTSDAL